MIELILATQIFLMSNLATTPCALVPYENRGCINLDTHEIYIQSTLPKQEQYFVLFHEQGHNIMAKQYRVPSLFKNEEYRADEFGWWMIEKKYNQQNTYIQKNGVEDIYFQLICSKQCVKTLLSIKL